MTQTIVDESNRTFLVLAAWLTAPSRTMPHDGGRGAGVRAAHHQRA
jgi:hypothetical protein